MLVHLYVYSCLYIHSVFFVIPDFKIDVKLSFNVTVWSIHTNEDVFLNQNFFSATPSKLTMCANVRVSDHKISLLCTHIHTYFTYI